LARLPGLAEELVRLKPDVMLCGTILATLAIQQATATIPIVNATLTDPEGFGLIASMARPEGQVTGILTDWEGLPTKLLQLALEVLPGATRIGFLSNISTPVHLHTVFRRGVEAAIATFARNLVTVEGPRAR
jgi:putative ABC transport system substrate-binding protein